MDASDVSAEYRRLGYDQGWSFATTPVANIPKANVVVVGLNPGGSGEAYGELWEFPEGNAYFDERWIPGSGDLMPLQVQMAALHELLGLGKDDVFAGQFIPFRSPSRITLARPNEAIAFGLQLWRWVLDRSPARLFLCLGAEAASNIASLLEAKPDGRLPSGWGNITIGRYVSPSGKVVVQLPHLSRFLLFSMGPAQLEIAKASILKACRPWPITPEDPA